jgi:hypothetical protein
MKKQTMYNAAPRAVVTVCILAFGLLAASVRLVEVFPVLALGCGMLFVLLAGWLAGYSLES